MFYHFYDFIKNKYFDELKVLPPATREALIFKKTCEEIPLTIKEGDVIAGWYGCESDADIKIENNRDFAFVDAYTKKERSIKQKLLSDFCIDSGRARAHTCIDYGHIITFGLKDYEKKVMNELNKENLSESKQILLEAMLISIESVKIYAKRFSDLASKTFDKTKEERLLKIKTALSSVPYEPAKNFYEAISAIWIMHSLIPISENCWDSLSLGRVDQYLYPFYKKSIENGESIDELKGYLKNLFIFLDSFGDGACALNIGGMDKDGNDEMNELSRLLLEVEKEMCLAAPIFVIRTNPNTPEDIIDESIDIKLFSIGQPSYYGEMPCRNALIERGVNPQDVVKFSVNTCMGLYMAGEESNSAWGCTFNAHLPLELAIGGGKPIFKELPFEVDNFDCGNDLNTLLDTYEKYLRVLLGVSLGFNIKNNQNCANNTPSPLLSAITEGCVEKGLDITVGSKYNTETVEAFAFANTVDAICAIDTLVFKEKKYTLCEYINAVKHKFVRFEQVLRDIKSCAKFGTNNKYADEVAQKLCLIFSRVCKDLSFDNVYFTPSLHTLDVNVSFGERLYTTLDGRLAGTPVAKNAGPTDEVRTPDPTSLIISAASIRQELFSGGQALDLYFDKSSLETKEQRDKIKALIMTYFSLGGLQIQVNSVDVELLEKAYENPDEYKHLIVRIGGYSHSFVQLSKSAQKEFIERFKKERGI